MSCVGSVDVKVLKCNVIGMSRWTGEGERRPGWDCLKRQTENPIPLTIPARQQGSGNLWSLTNGLKQGKTLTAGAKLWHQRQTWYSTKTAALSNNNLLPNCSQAGSRGARQAVGPLFIPRQVRRWRCSLYISTSIGHPSDASLTVHPLALVESQRPVGHHGWPACHTCVLVHDIQGGGAHEQELRTPRHKG